MKKFVILTLLILAIGFRCAGDLDIDDARLPKQAPNTVVLYAPLTTPPAPPPTVGLENFSAIEAEQADIAAWDAIAKLDSPYADLLKIAVDAGWPADPEVLSTLARIIHKESRGQNIGPGDPRWNGSDTGIVQINEIHTAYVEQLYHEPFIDAMVDPWKNLNFAWILYSSREQAGKCGWQPWRIEC